MNLYQPTITGSLSVSGSVNISGSISIAGGGTISGTASIATTALTASSADNFLVRNTLTAQTLVVQTITSSVDFVTGSTRFGSVIGNTHQFTGSVLVSGSVTSQGGFILGNSATIAPTGSIGYNNAVGVFIYGKSGSEADFRLYNKDGLTAMSIIAGTQNVNFAGNVGIGTSIPNARLSLGNTTSTAKLLLYDGGFTGSGGNGYFAGFAIDSPNANDTTLLAHHQGALVFGRYTNANDTSAITERMRITSAGNVVIGATSTPYKLQVESSAVSSYFKTSSGYAAIAFSGNANTTVGAFTTFGTSIYIGRANGVIGNQFGVESDLLITSAGNVIINGSLSKGSGSFRIKHPLTSKKNTHQLVHSFIEGPQADLIYRGKVRLVAGKATINIDEAATMTEGTFEALCREVQCFTSNETSWDAVRGKVEGNILTIECQNTESTDEISWMVVGERQDEHIMDTEWTDENGKVIVEPLI
jgi:hypothetical protein